jgi:subtilisin family serine protease
MNRRTRHPRSLLAGLLTLGSLAIFTAAPSTQSPIATVDGYEVAADEVLVKFRVPHTPPERIQLRNQIAADRDEEVGGIGLTRFHSRTFDAESLLAFFRSQPNVEYAEPNYILRTTAVPNDPQFGQLWGLRNTGQAVNGGSPGTPGADIRAVPAWDISTGSRNNVVGVVDTGVDYTHPDLAANVWSAPSGFTVVVGGRAITCAAGTHGFNAIINTCDPMDDHDHGSHVSGTIGAVGNNATGVAGVNWTASIMGLKFLSSSGSGTTVAAINAIEFAIQVKSVFSGSGGANVRVLSNSWGGGAFTTAMLDEINRANASGMLFVAAAGNAGTNTDLTPFYPASYNVPNVVAVAATSNYDGLASFSNYGATSVDLGAPGVNVLSTTRGNTYRFFNGTSMATPHVSGAAMLVLSRCSLDTAALKSNLLANVDRVPALSGITVTGGRLNVNNAIRACGAPSAPPAPTGLAATPGNARVTLGWSAATGATSYNVKRSTTSGTEVSIATGITSTTYLDTAVTNGTTYFYVVTAVNAIGESGASNEVSARPLAPPPPPAGLTAAPGNAQVTLAWGSSGGATSYTVKRSTTSGLEVSIATGVAGTSYIDTTVTNGVRYFYVVTAVNGSGASGPSNEVSATPTAPVASPPAPTGLRATVYPGHGVLLEWGASTSGSTYTVKRSTTGGGPYSIIASGISQLSAFNSIPVGGGVTYYYVVSAVNSGLTSPNSNEVSATVP